MLHDKSRCRLRCIPILFCLLASGPAILRAEPADVKDHIAKAIRLTSEKKFADARQEYEEAARLDAERGIPALARFIGLAGSDDDRRRFRQRLEQNAEKWNAAVLAMAYSAMGDDAKASSLLAADERVLAGEPASATLLLARLLRTSGDDKKAEDILCDALVACKNRQSQVLFFDAMTGDDRLMLHDDAERFSAAIDSGLRAIGTDEDALIRRMDPVIISLTQENAGYFKLRDELLAQDLKAKPGAALFVARMLQREERPADALAFIDPIERALETDPFWPALAQAEIQILQSLERHEDAKVLYQVLIAKSPTALSTDAIKDAATIALATNDADQALTYLSQLTMKDLSFDDRSNVWTMIFIAAGIKADNGLIIETYIQACREASLDQMNMYNQAIFGKMRETTQHIALEKAVRDHFEKDKSTPPRLWMLAAGAAAVARRPPNQVEAL
ncbi:MAG: hypothetical protein ABI579_06695, partial [Candidatus Sumerlaeota bacterium]